jgi:cytochrome c oxidase subunit 2
VTIICIAIFALVGGVSVYSVFKFRAAPDDEEDGSPIHGHTGLEIVWTAVPAALVTAISVYSGVVLTQIQDIPEDHRVVEVTAQQFAWSFHYPDLDITSGELALPVGEPVELKLNSKDVIHAFWVPEWRLKQDTVPGIETRVRVTPNRVGSYAVVCTELCGLGHAVMRARATVLEQEGFDRWVREQQQAAAGGGAGGGAQLFVSQGCGGCHALEDAATTGAVGPSLDESLAGRDAAFVEESILDPDAVIAEGYQAGVMPQNFDELLSDEQLDALVEYLVSATNQGG